MTNGSITFSRFNKFLSSRVNKESKSQSSFRFFTLSCLTLFQVDLFQVVPWKNNLFRPCRFIPDIWHMKASISLTIRQRQRCFEIPLGPKTSWIPWFLLLTLASPDNCLQCNTLGIMPAIFRSCHEIVPFFFSLSFPCGWKPYFWWSL